MELVSYCNLRLQCPTINIFPRCSWAQEAGKHKYGVAAEGSLFIPRLIKVWHDTALKVNSRHLQLSRYKTVTSVIVNWLHLRLSKETTFYVYW